MSEPIIVAGRECHFLDRGDYWRITDGLWGVRPIDWLCGDGQWHEWLGCSPAPNEWPTEAAAREFALAATHSQPGKGDADGWTQEPPTEQGTYWHWNGDDDSAPLPMFVAWSGFTGKCFVSMGQLGISQAIDCDQYGGWWKPLNTPLTPTEIERARRTPIPTPPTQEQSNA